MSHIYVHEDTEIHIKKLIVTQHIQHIELNQDFGVVSTSKNSQA